MEISQKTKWRVTPGSNNFVSGYILKRIKSRNLEVFLLIRPCSQQVIHDSPELEGPSVDEWVNKWLCIHSGLFLSFQRKQILACYSLDEPGGHHAKWSRTNTIGVHVSEIFKVDRFLEKEARGWGGGNGDLMYQGDDFHFSRWKGFCGGWGSCWHSNVRGPNAPVFYALINGFRMVYFVLCLFYYNFF